ncbi:MAG: 50S ribosomal protein L32 [Salinispira sp.]
MAVPKKRFSKARTRRHHSINRKLTIGTLSVCSNCGASKLPHRVCTTCGFYNGRQVLEPENL